MYKAPYYKADGKKGRARELPASIFDGVVNEAVLHQAVKAYRANQRQGTAAAKTRSQVAGGNHKPWRQKGTGRARQGTIRAVQWEGGGRAFPPIPHSWRQSLNRKVKALARRSAFNARAEGEQVAIIDTLAMENPKTAELREYLKALDLAQTKVLILTDGVRPTVHLSARNLPNVEVRPFGQEAVYEILWAERILIEREALDRLSQAAEPDEDAAEPDAEAEPVEAAAESAEATAEATEAAAEATEAAVEAAEAAPAKKKTSRKKPAAEKASEATEAEENA